MKMTVEKDEMIRIINTDHFDPFRVLGMKIIEQKGKPSLVVRTFLPDASEVYVVELDNEHEVRSYCMKKLDDAGFFECVIPGRKEVFRYKLRKETPEGVIETFYDSYAFLPTLTDFDLYLFNAGDHHRIYEKLGAHFAEVNGIGGIQFAVWAPAARSVSVIGSFNGWDRRNHAMRSLGSSGVWEIFIPGLPEGELYKFQIKTQNGTILDKCDPYGFEMELRPSTAARVNLLTGFDWTDKEWIDARTVEQHLSRPLSIYEVHLASWARLLEEGNRWLTYKELAHKLVEYVKQRGFTHIELLPVMEHPLDASWGYQVTGYFAATSRFGKPQDFMYFVNHCHLHGVGVILDWVPAHFPKDIHALGEFDGTHLYEHSDPKKGEHQDWGTYIFNYGRHEVKNFLISNALYWIDKFHIDGFRIDAVASMLYLDYSRQEGEWIPNQYGGRENIEAIEFLRSVNTIVHHYYPGILTIAEESTAWPGVTNTVEQGGLGFDLKWNMGWMHDMLEYFSKDPIYRPYHHRNLTFALLYAFTEKFLLPLSHDESVHGKKALLDKMPGDLWQKFANLRALYSLMFSFPGKKLLFMGGEFGQWKEWDHDTSLDWHLLEYETHNGILRLTEDLQSIYQNSPALYEMDFQQQGFEWLDFHDAAGSIISFIRKAKHSDHKVIVVCNFTPVPRSNYRIGLPEEGKYLELFNSDSAYYGGGNIGNGGAIEAEPIPFHHREYSMLITIPPLGVLYLQRDTAKHEE
ncbi:MAG: 1,4-alpha-glucan branching protein GlgB [bacterium]